MSTDTKIPLTPTANDFTPKHHKFGMSKLNAVAACPGFTSKEGTSEAAEDGTRLHEIMQKVAELVMPHNGSFKSTAKEALTFVLLSNPVSEEEHIYLGFCCTELDFWLAKKPIRLLVEEKIHLFNPDGTELNYGTGDLIIFLTEESAVILDWKFGWIPVPRAETNLQGKGYSAGTFQKYPRLKKVGVVFSQPKLHQSTVAIFLRAQFPEMYAEIKRVIAAAQAENKSLRPCQYCDFCAIAGTCKALLNEAQRAVSLHENLPMPQSFVGLQIQTPEEAARALYVLDRLEVLIRESGLKERAKELARQNGDKLSCKLPDGSQVTVELRQRNSPRSANSPILIAEALKDVLTPEQVLAACDPKITRLEEIFAEAYVEKMNAEAQRILDEADQKAVSEPERATEIHKVAKAQAKAVRVTKKQAHEILEGTLLSEGCLSLPDGKVDYLKIRIEKPTTQIVYGSESNITKTH